MRFAVRTAAVVAINDRARTHRSAGRDAVPRPRRRSRATCPERYLASTRAQGGTCLEAAVIGDDVVAACSQSFTSKGWQPNPDAAALIGAQTGKTLACFRSPPP